MPCAAGVGCKLPGQTPGPSAYTIHKYAEIAESLVFWGLPQKSLAYLITSYLFSSEGEDGLLIVYIVYGGDSNKKAKQTNDYYFYFYFRT